MSLENLISVMEKCGAALDVDLSLGDDDSTLVRVDDKFDLAISFDHDTQSLVLNSACGLLPEEPEILQKLLLEMMDANYLGAGTGGMVLATNSQAGTVHLQYRAPTHQLDEAILHGLLRAIVQNSELWSSRLATGNWEAVRSSPTEEGADMQAGGLPFQQPQHMVRI